jgi:hypothetical protein
VARLEGCTILHCAAISGNSTMTRIVSYIWEEVQYKIMHDTRVQQSVERLAAQQTRVSKDFYDEIRNEVRHDHDLFVSHDCRQFLTTTSLGFTAYDMVPQCTAANCTCSSGFLGTPCASHKTRKLLFRRLCHFRAPSFFRSVLSVPWPPCSHIPAPSLPSPSSPPSSMWPGL